MIVLETVKGGIEDMKKKMNDPIANEMISMTDTQGDGDNVIAREVTQKSKGWKQETQKRSRDPPSSTALEQ